MSDQNEKQKPIKTFDDGRMSAAIWAKEGEHGLIYNTTLNYSYKDKDGNWRDTQSIPAQELLKVSNLAQRAYDHVLRLKEHDRAQYVQQEQAQSQDRPGPRQSREH